MESKSTYPSCPKGSFVKVISRLAAALLLHCGRLVPGALGLMAAALIVGCSPMYYSATSQNVPLIEEKGMTALNMSGNAGQVAFHAAHGLGENIAVKADVAAAFPGESFDVLHDDNRFAGRYAEMGAGYFTVFQNRFIIEAYAIVGYGESDNDYFSGDEDVSGGSGRLKVSNRIVGVQPNFGYKTEHFELAVSARFFHLQFTGIDGELIYNGINQGDILRDHKSHFIAEPALTCRFGTEKAKVQLQWAYIANSIPDQKINMLGTIGLNLTF